MLQSAFALIVFACLGLWYTGRLTTKMVGEQAVSMLNPRVFGVLLLLSILVVLLWQ